MLQTSPIFITIQHLCFSFQTLQFHAFFTARSVNSSSGMIVTDVNGSLKQVLYLLKVNFFKKLCPVIFRYYRHFFEFSFVKMFFGLPLDVNLKSQKFKKWREFLIITGLSFKKSTYKKCSTLGNRTI